MENRMKGKYEQASTKAELMGIRVQSEVYYDNSNKQYHAENSTSCDVGMFTDPTIKKAITTIIETWKETPVCSITEGGQAWAVSVSFSDGLGSFCVDSKGIATSTIINPATGLCSE